MSDSLKNDVMNAAKEAGATVSTTGTTTEKAFSNPAYSQYTYYGEKSFGKPQVLNENGFVEQDQGECLTVRPEKD